MGWYKTVTYRKTRVCAINTTEFGACHIILIGPQMVLERIIVANQIDMTGPNSVVLFAQTLVCSLCNYYMYNIYINYNIWPPEKYT